MPAQHDVIRALHADRRLAHRVLFAHRHPDETAPFQDEMVELWHSTHPRIIFLAFRGSAKSTMGEEGLVVEALFGEFHNALVMGDSYERAVERLAAVKRELETNAAILEIFGDQVGPVWQQGKIELRNGVVMQAFGQGQSVRGVKHLDWRPDRLMIDDLENEESVATPEARKKLHRWFTRALLPALDPSYRARMLATPLDPASLPMELARSGQWLTRTYPIEHLDPVTGERTPTWPARFPLAKIDALRAAYTALGDLQGFLQEYMVQAVDDSTRVFTTDMFKVEPTVRTWQPVYAFYDPARTTKKTSDQTGKVVWSWIGPRLVVWEASGHFWQPDELINDIFAVDARYNPVAIGVEEDGLNEFILQPLRTAQADRAIVLPISPTKAPKGKLEFIRGLQPYFKAGEVVFNEPFEALRQQLLNFPTGLIDIANALAYAPRLRPGQPLYEHFNQNCIAAPLPVRNAAVYLACNAAAGFTTAALVQLHQGTLYVHADWVREGDPGMVLRDMLQEASLAAGTRFKVVAPPQHWTGYETLALRAVCGKAMVETARGGAEHLGREEIRRLIRRQTKGAPSLRVAETARWCLRSLAGGYARPFGRDGTLLDVPPPGPCRTLMEGLESFAALMQVATQQDDSEGNFAYTASGQRYRSALAR